MICAWCTRPIKNTPAVGVRQVGRVIMFHADSCHHLWVIDTSPHVTDRNAGPIRRPRKPQPDPRPDAPED
jgi:hypothetical protein